MVRISAEGLRDDPVERGFDLVGSLAGGKAGAIAHAENVRVDRERLLAECGVEYDIGGLSPDSRQLLELFARTWHFAAEAVDQGPAQCDDVLRLGIEQADGLDRFAQALLAEADHLPRSLHALEQRSAGDVDAGVGRLRREHHRDQQGVGVDIVEFGGRGGVRLREAAEELEDLLTLHSDWITSRIE